MPILMLCRVHYRIHLNYNLHKGVLAWLFTGKKTVTSPSYTCHAKSLLAS